MQSSATRARRFTMVDVFAESPFLGNPLPVVVDADGLDGEAMMRITRWFNQSETTFLLPAQHPDAHYRVRIFTLERELPFAGHPTLGSCRVWLDQLAPQHSGDIVQQCGVGLVRIRPQAERLSFAAPPLLRSGPVGDAAFDEVAGILGLGRDAIKAMVWADNGPGWIAVELASADAVLALKPVRHHPRRMEIGVVGPYPEGHELAYEVRTFFSDADGNLREDPVTGSFNASAAQVLLAGGRYTTPYQAHQGRCLGRAGFVHVDQAEGQVWIGGKVQTIVAGTINA